MQFTQFLLIAPIFAAFVAASRDGLGSEIEARNIHLQARNIDLEARNIMLEARNVEARMAANMIEKRCDHVFFEGKCKDCKKGLCKSNEIIWCDKAVAKGHPCGDKGTTIHWAGFEIPKGWADSCKGCSH